jgi:choline kinase
MQAVILAAGMATRLRPLTDATPKCLLDVGGRSILGRTVDNLLEAGIADIAIVTGYRDDMIRDFMASSYPRLRVAWAHNGRYAETNNAYSLLLAESLVRGPFVLLDSDILFPTALLERVLAFGRRPALAVDRHPCSAEEIKVSVNEEGALTDIGKQLESSTAYGESIGVEAFGTDDGAALFAALKRRVVGMKLENEFYEASFRDMILGGASFAAVDTSDCPAMEIDSPEDLERARSLAREKLAR